ncbi:MAG: aminopeptidase P family protein [Bacteroidota bacterium]
MIHINDRIHALRQLMQARQLDAYLIPSSDPHQSEYVADHWKSRIWASGFTGSAGIVVITADHAGLWTDSRYFLQAEEELAGSEMVLHQQLIPHAPEHISWMAEHLPKGATVACDGMLFSISQVRALAKAFHRAGLELDHQQDLIAEVWRDRPALPDYPVFEHKVAFSGKSRVEKLQAVRAAMQQRGASHYFISTLDDIAWLFNLRGSDVECNPVFIAYAVIGPEVAYLFVNQTKLAEDLQNALRGDGVLLKGYETIADYLGSLQSPHRLLIDRSTISIQLNNLIDRAVALEGDNICRQLKAIKNETEVGHIRDAMRKDGVALTRLYRWLDAELANRSIPEVEVAAQLAAFRKAQGDYHGESFSAIVGYKGNGAIVHYRPMPGKCADIQKEGILLLDSGGQYTNGTTDITRTTALGTPSEEQKRNFTLVLKGHIALATIQFPAGTRGIQLDTLARQFLWQQGLNYGHGTGHGVGFFLNVHEPPQGFATSISQRGVTIFEPGMFTSNEPGYYKTGEYGIRIENLVLTVNGTDNGHGHFLRFETLTLFPIDLNLVERSLLTAGEIEWLNAYHERVYRELAPLLSEEEAAWMKEQCRAI